MRYYMAAEHVANKAARALIDSDAIQHYNWGDPFRLSGGMLSPVYVDCRRLIYQPFTRRQITDMMVEQIAETIGYKHVQVIAGGETAGIPFAAWIAERMGLPMVYVRKQAKGFGRNLGLEGGDVHGKRVLLIEDLTTDGKSKVGFCKMLRDAGATVQHCSVVFFYNLPALGCAEVFRENGIYLHYLCSWPQLLPMLLHQVSMTRAQIEDIEQFVADPTQWKPRSSPS